MVDELSGGNAATVTADAGGVSPAPQQTESTAGSAAPAGQETQATGTTDSTEREGFIPRSRFDEVNTRMTAAEKQMAEWKERHGWAESVKREDLAEMSGWYAQYKGDPGDFLERAYQEALIHPVHGATVKSRIARMMASMRQAPPEQEPSFEPDVPVMNEQGQIVSRTYSAELFEKKLQHEISKALHPLKQDYDTRQETAKQAKEREQQQAQAHAQADADVAYVTKRPLFKEHKDEVLKVFKENPTMSLREAYDHVIDTKVLPGFGQKAEAKVLSDLQQKANAQTVHSGASSSADGLPKFKDSRELIQYMHDHPDVAERWANR